ncbi:VOC family protein [Parahaliea aestuarii]|uniref:VOC family protein n=1 Tax=Parahaliea aestuarii TaxID=1852021 RepID=A0A5C9A541_9GAMM|nr:VOC family protein [Parahaliea aestuarii]TXS94850.1 VOC family protein [Parahaliea aestuarii]
MSVKPIPDGYHSVTPYLSVRNATEAIDFYCRALDAEELFRLEMDDGRIGHAELRIGSSIIMLADEFPEMGNVGPETLNGSAVGLMIYLENVDSGFSTAVAAGGTELRPVTNQFYGDRSGTFRDPFGHVWTLATHVEDVPQEELKQRMAEFAKG